MKGETTVTVGWRIEIDDLEACERYVYKKEQDE